LLGCSEKLYNFFRHDLCVPFTHSLLFQNDNGEGLYGQSETRG
jgi:hypothetical protein